ncbi:MAG TPA: LysR family transcriptional regulator [Pseudonocardia sp.]|jgi:DNA-binding transcriptional LysR family regulator|uniref:LysR family transcriptional regulator n=1 Tax=Pseudonocardia sp. TaxID=60912 RepID=UPI002B9FCE5D|nr:LysR family transcriptional regulator [Pseudonocardia sp.]HTF47734.1 LysR family transcriptional regulator [Pseudonocardia sp.]
MDAHLRDLRYFVAVADELGFTRAAERLFISQPALSKQIRQLESLLRVALFERGHRGVALTAAGAALLPAARQLLTQWDEAQRAVGDAAAYAAAVLRVGISTSVGRGLLPAIKCAFTERRPGWQLQIRQIDWNDPSVGLRDGSTDVTLRWLPVPEPSAVSWQVLSTEPRWVAMSAKHRLADCQEVDFADLLDEPFLALPTSAGPLRDYWLAIDHRQGRPIRVGAEVHNADETFEAVANCLGVVLLSEGNASIYRREDVIARPVKGLTPSELAVAWRVDDHRTAIKDFVDACAGNSTPKRS